MTSNHLHRDHAPISAEAFALIEAQARDVLQTNLAARKIVDLDGPHGWAHTAVDLGRTSDLPQLSDGAVRARLRRTQPLIELRVPFSLSLAELDDIDRGAVDPGLDPVMDAAKSLARAEDHAVFYGVPDAGVHGIVSHAEHATVPLAASFEDFPSSVVRALAQLRDSGVSGPYAVLLDASAYAKLTSLTGPGGYPVLHHVQRLIEGPALWAPALQGALVVSLRGGDFQLVLGQDVSLGYLAHDRKHVELYLEESFTFRLLGPEAAVPLVASP